MAREWLLFVPPSVGDQTEGLVNVRPALQQAYCFHLVFIIKSVLKHGFEFQDFSPSISRDDVFL